MIFKESVDGKISVSDASANDNLFYTNGKEIKTVFKYIRQYLDHLPKGANVLLHGILKQDRNFKVDKVEIQLADGSPADPQWLDDSKLRVLIPENML